jgi:hypothetical protein
MVRQRARAVPSGRGLHHGQGQRKGGHVFGRPCGYMLEFYMGDISILGKTRMEATYETEA